MITIAHVSDPHLDVTDRAVERAERVMAYLSLRPGLFDVLLLTGDVANDGSPEEYAQVRPLLDRSPTPVFLCPGNHDDRGAFRVGLLDEPANDNPINRIHRIDGAVFAMCDSTIPGRDDGRLADETLAWLESELADTPGSTPVFVSFHHPPVVLHSPFIDRTRQTDEQRLADVCRRHRNIVAVLCGHAHTPAATTFAGKPLIVAPGIASTLVMPWDPGGDLDPDAPPGLAVHVLDDDWRLTTHFRALT
jgi:Icc protein